MSFEVVPYTIENLVDLFATEANISAFEVSLKQHKKFFEIYFNELGANTIVAELSYIDHDYLEDYSNYYVKCFHDYGRKCARLHFFKEKFSREEFCNVLSTQNDPLLKNIQETYLGFIVVKPLPKTIIGRTCLKTYSQEDTRTFPSIRYYEANLFGICLKVKSLAFQEQDSVAAACATSALWSVFHGTGMLFHHPIPSPIEITKAALEKSPAETRNLPNKGLTLTQIGHAVREVGLDPFLVKATNDHVLKSTVYGYLCAGIPVYCSISLFDVSKNPPAFFGGHGVAITGFRTDPDGPRPMGGTGFLLKATRIEKFYVHDDQIGPFARMEFDGVPLTLPDPNTKQPVHYLSLSTSWRDDMGRAFPNAILIPLYHKVRIPYEIVHDIVLEFDQLLELHRQHFTQVLPERLEWDIYLSQINSFKSEILTSHDLENSLKECVLVNKMPKYLWRAIGSIGNARKIEFIFDATDIEQGNVFIRSIGYDEDLHAILGLLSQKPAITCVADKSKPIFTWFAIHSNS